MVSTHCCALAATRDATSVRTQYSTTPVGTIAAYSELL
jgi:hypothetical protein